MDMPDDIIIRIAPEFKGQLTEFDAINAGGGMSFTINAAGTLNRGRSILVQVICEGYHHEIGLFRSGDAEEIYIHRNDKVLRVHLLPQHSSPFYCKILWSPDEKTISYVDKKQ